MTVGDLNNRELAVLIWLVPLLFLGLVNRDVRRSAAALVVAFAQPAVLLSTAGFALYTAAAVNLGDELGLWQSSLVKETIFWFLGIGFGLLMNVGEVSRRDGWFRREVTKAVRITVFVGLFVNLVVLPLPLELVLAPTLAVLVMSSAVAEGREDLRPARSCAEGLLGAVGFGLIAYSAGHVVADWSGYTEREDLQALALPVWLTIAALPFVYIVGVWSSYQTIFRRIDDETQIRRARLRAKLAVVFGLHAQARELGQFRAYDARMAAEAPSFAAARLHIRDFRGRLAEERRLEVEREERLERFAGVDGADSGGRRLDQREFEETKDALRWLAVCMSGWYSNEPEGYREDLVPIVEPFDGLPQEHGIKLFVSPDRRAWWAYRRTITGWCFAIGAAQPPPDEWLYDGPEPPSGFPGKDPAWGERWGIEAPNWNPEVPVRCLPGR